MSLSGVVFLSLPKMNVEQGSHDRDQQDTNGYAAAITQSVCEPKKGASNTQDAMHGDVAISPILYPSGHVLIHAIKDIVRTRGHPDCHRCYMPSTIIMHKSPRERCHSPGWGPVESAARFNPETYMFIAARHEAVKSNTSTRQAPPSTISHTKHAIALGRGPWEKCCPI